MQEPELEQEKKIEQPQPTQENTQISLTHAAFDIFKGLNVLNTECTEEQFKQAETVFIKFIYDKIFQLELTQEEREKISYSFNGLVSSFVDLLKIMAVLNSKLTNGTAAPGTNNCSCENCQ